MLKKSDIRIRDPFILIDDGKYYMYGTTDFGDGIAAQPKYSAYVSSDLESFEGPFCIFDGEAIGFWATKDYWAAEVWKHNGKYYLFGSFKSETHTRASQILESDNPLGPFKPISDKPTTPEEWECLDGTFFVENGKPYMVFCHEWVQCVDGEMCAVELSEDLSSTVGEPVLLFRAGDNPAVSGFNSRRYGENCKITDGPFLFKRNGKLNMIWSSHSNGKYAVLEAEADSLFSEWHHKPGRFEFDGGHAMIFKALDGKEYISLHKPNKVGEERATFIEFTD